MGPAPEIKVKLLVAGAAVALVAAAGVAFLREAPAEPGGRSRPAPALSSAYPGGQPIDATRIQSGRLTLERMPEEISAALEVHSAEIVRTAEVLATKQARISGACGPGSAIRIVGEDGSVVCQRLPRGVSSVTALAGLPRVSSTGTAQASVPGGVGRYQTSGEDDFLVVPLSLPDGAVVTGFTYVYWDEDDEVDGAAYLYRSDDTVMAALGTTEAKEEVRMVATHDIAAPRVDNAAFAYFVYMQLSARAGPDLMPIAASVTYRLP